MNGLLTKLIALWAGFLTKDPTIQQRAEEEAVADAKAALDPAVVEAKALEEAMAGVDTSAAVQSELERLAAERVAAWEAGEEPTAEEVSILEAWFNEQVAAGNIKVTV